MPKILNRLLAEGRLRGHRTSARQIADLMGVVERNLAEAEEERREADGQLSRVLSALGLSTVGTVLVSAEGGDLAEERG
jgi:hypothetical protein